MRHDITIGARVHEDEADRFQPKNLYQQVINNGRPAFEFVEQIAPTGGDNRIDEAEALNLFVADRIAVNRDLTVTALLRYEDIETSQTRWSTIERTSASGTETASNDTSALPAEAIAFYSDYENTARNCSIANPCSVGNQTIDSGTVS